MGSATTLVKVARKTLVKLAPGIPRKYRCKLKCSVQGSILDVWINNEVSMSDDDSVTSDTVNEDLVEKS